MQRRTVLVSGGVTATQLLAGCTGTPSGDDTSGNYTPVRDRETELEDGDVVFESDRVVNVSDSDRLFLEGEITNTSDALGADVVVHAAFYDDDGAVHLERSTSVGNLGPGSTNEFTIDLSDEDVELPDVVDYELSWSQSSEPATDG